jgi:hypothetical protein
MSFQNEIAAYEVFEALKDADFDVTLTLRGYSADQRQSNGVVTTGSYKVVVDIRPRSGSEFTRFLRVCEALRMEWEVDPSGRSVTVEPQYKDWIEEYREIKARDGRTKGFCAECEKEVRKPATSAVCEDCKAKAVCEARFGFY